MLSFNYQFWWASQFIVSMTSCLFACLQWSCDHVWEQTIHIQGGYMQPTELLSESSFTLIASDRFQSMILWFQLERVHLHTVCVFYWRLGDWSMSMDNPPKIQRTSLTDENKNFKLSWDGYYFLTVSSCLLSTFHTTDPKEYVLNTHI